MILKASTGEYGDAVADFYDNFYRHYEDQYLIAEYCRSIHPEARRILEFGIGQGRLALSLARTGFEVTGIDSSPRMLERLKEQGEGLAIEAVHANFTDSLDLGDFDLVLIGTSTLFMVSTQEDQITTLRRAREHLGDDGRLIIDTYNPLSLVSGPRTQTVAHPCGTDTVLIDTITCDPASQQLYYMHQFVGPHGARFVPELSRWAWPAELDLMAQQAGLRLSRRDGDMKGTPWGPAAPSMVSVYEPSNPL